MYSFSFKNGAWEISNNGVILPNAHIVNVTFNSTTCSTSEGDKHVITGCTIIINTGGKDPQSINITI